MEFFVTPTEPNNVISILISSDFLKMDALVWMYSMCNNNNLILLQSYFYTKLSALNTDFQFLQIEDYHDTVK